METLGPWLHSFDGRLVTPSPHWTHQRAVHRLAMLLDPYVRTHGIGEVFTSPIDVKLEPGLVLHED